MTSMHHLLLQDLEPQPPSNEGIPILISARNGAQAKAVAAKLSPKYDVVHISISHRSDLFEIPAILHGRLVTPSFAGSNLYRAYRERRAPRAIVFSSAVSRSEIEEIKNCSKGRDAGVRFVEYGKTDMLRYGFPGVTATERLVRELLEKEGL